MSIVDNQQSKVFEQADPCVGFDRVLSARQINLGGFNVRRLLPSNHQKMVGPWIFFDHFGPAHMKPSEGIDIRPHPHINMATVTYLFEGGMLHQDSTGAVQTILPGDVNVMFAGNGIVHSERTPEDIRKAGFDIEGLQLWLAVPKTIEEDNPAFYHFNSSTVPSFTQGNVKGRVIMGAAYGVQSPVIVFSPTLYVEAFIPDGSKLVVPDHMSEVAVYIINGSVVSNGITFEEGEMAIVHHQSPVEITAVGNAQIAIIGGEPIGPRYIWWNFVSSDMERINEAARRWEKGLFKQIPTDHFDFIPLPK